MLYIRLFMLAGIGQIKDTADEHITGLQKYKNIKQSLPGNWLSRIERETVKVGGVDCHICT